MLPLAGKVLNITFKVKISKFKFHVWELWREAELFLLSEFSPPKHSFSRYELYLTF